MSKIDYYQLAEDIKDMLDADPLTQNILKTIEVDEAASLEMGPSIDIRIEGRQIREQDQTINNSTSFRAYINVVLMIFVFDLDSKRHAMQTRDTIIGDVEMILLNDPTIGGKVDCALLDGGSLDSGQTQQNGYFCAGEVKINIELTAHL